MADPVIKGIAVGTTPTKVATNVTTAKLHVLRTVANGGGTGLKYMQSYRLTGTGAPSDMTDAVPLFDETRHEDFSSTAASDIYVWCVGGAGSIRVDA